MTKGMILKKGEFDFNALMKARQKKAANGGKSLIDTLAEISPEIAQLHVGDTAKIPMNGGAESLRKSVMAIVAKLNNLTPKGEPWAGRQFKVASDGEKFIYVQRGPNIKPDDQVERKRGKGGGRKKKTDTPVVASETPSDNKEVVTETPAQAAKDVVDKGETVTAASGAVVKVHA